MLLQTPAHLSAIGYKANPSLLSLRYTVIFTVKEFLFSTKKDPAYFRIVRLGVTGVHCDGLGKLSPTRDAFV